MSVVITTIITTAPYSHMNESFHLQHAVQSLSRVPMLLENPVFICFDGGEIDPSVPLNPRCAHPTDLAEYERYKDRNKSWILERVPHAQFFELPFRGCLTRNIHQCFHKIETEYIHIMQHDLPIEKEIPLLCILEVMNQHPEIKLVRYAARAENRFHEEFTRDAMGIESLPQEEVELEGTRFSRCNQWSDQNHITTRRYYQDLVFPETLPQYGFMENHLLFKPITNHTRYGTYYLGGYEDGGYCRHSDARNTIK